VATLLSTCQTFTSGIEAVPPVWLAQHLWDDVLAKMLQNGITKTALVIQQRRGVEVSSACKAG
jgi:hypothetical protein